jgi:hypothetical protein
LRRLRRQPRRLDGRRQTAVDEPAQISLAAELGYNAADVGQLLPMLGAMRANSGAAPDLALADARYRSEEHLQTLAGSSI